HDLIDVLVGARDFVQQQRGPAELDAGHGGFQILHGKGGPCLGAGHAAASTVGSRVKRLRIAESGDDITARAHGSGNHAPHAFAGFDGTFAGDPNVVTEVLLDLREIVVAIDALDFELAFVPSLA